MSERVKDKGLLVFCWGKERGGSQNMDYFEVNAHHNNS